MTRSERYKRALAMTSHVLFELQEKHKWSAHESAVAISLVDDTVPISLHNVGELFIMALTFIAYDCSL